jgi:hypothetical protein
VEYACGLLDYCFEKREFHSNFMCAFCFILTNVFLVLHVTDNKIDNQNISIIELNNLKFKKTETFYKRLSMIFRFKLIQWKLLFFAPRYIGHIIMGPIILIP